MTLRNLLLVSAVALMWTWETNASAQETPAPGTPAASAHAPPGKPRAGATRKKPGKAPPVDATSAGEGKPDAAQGASPARATGKRKPSSRSPAEPTGATEPARADAVTGGVRAPHEIVEHESRIEFDERMVRGQTAAGAIYLFQRAPTEFKSIVQVPDSFRARTTSMLASHRAAP